MSRRTADATPAEPPGPPSFLTEVELQSLSNQGYLGLGLPSYLQIDISAFFNAADAFFRLSIAEKVALYPGPVDNTELGYHHVAEEKQFVTFRYDPSSPNPPDIEKVVSGTWHDIAHLLYRILTDIGRYLDLHDDDVWLPLVQRSLKLPATRQDATMTLLRIFRYEPYNGTADPHADVGLLTLCVGKGRGLQVWERPELTIGRSEASTGMASTLPTPPASANWPRFPPSSTRWLDAPEVTLLVGDTLRVLSANRFKSGRHRVVSNPLGRDSLVFALRPDIDTVLDLRLYGGEGLVHTKALWDRIRNGRVNVNARKEVRESQRKEKRETAERKRAKARGREDNAEDVHGEVEEKA